MRVRDVMSIPAATVTPDDSLHVADGTMSLGRVRHLPVQNGPHLVGVISERDILRAPGVRTAVEGLAVDARALLRILRVGDAMSSPVITVAADAPVAEAARLLRQHRVGCLPVLEDGSLAGIVTTSDLLRAIEREGHAPGDGPSPAPGRRPAVTA